MNKRMTLHIGREYRSALRVACAKLDMTIKDFVEEAVKEKINRTYEDKREYKPDGLWTRIEKFFR